ncbi:hypothetical protein Ahy_B09g099718 [Arachis hypogaea]|uniref:CCHC-type domain-containing protein n=1 Tax=Arachis hypogaea TaxID=3818 RepID=A0A444XUI3_ARAHY|nr:hypothetical protein Ahy_B09g099718 [Arachis hypogaea]
MSEKETWQLRSMNLKHTCGQSHRVGITHTGWLSRAFKKKVEHNPKLGLDKLHWMRYKELIGSNTRGLLTTARSCYGLIQVLPHIGKKIERRGRSADLWEKINFDDVMPPPYQKPSHRPVKKRKRGPDEASDNSQSHLSRRGQIQRCSNCGESAHKRGGCKKLSLDAQQPRQPAVKRTKGGRKPSSGMPITKSKASSQPTMQSTSRGLATPFSVLTSSVPQFFSKTIVSPLITLSFSSLHIFTLKKNRALPVSPKKTLASSTAAAVRRTQKLRLFVVLQPLSSFPCSSSVLLAAQSCFACRLSSCSSPSSVVLVPRR